MVTRILLAVGLVAALFVAGCGKKRPGAPTSDEAESVPPAATGAKAAKAQTICPVMGGAINKTIYADHDGKRVYFCCAGCPEAFEKDTEKYLKKLEAEGVVLEKAPAGKLWTCSMHPQVRQPGPGKCPTCGMDLVRMPPGGGAEPHGSGGMQPHGSGMKHHGD